MPFPVEDVWGPVDESETEFVDTRPPTTQRQKEAKPEKKV